MTSTVLEIVELADGEFVLQRSEKDSEPLVTIKFSPEAMEFLADNSADVAKTMIEAGIHEVEEIMDDQLTSGDSATESQRVLH